MGERSNIVQAKLGIACPGRGGYQIDRVAIVVEKQFCLGVQSLAEKMPVWAPKLPHYELVAERVRESFPGLSLTLFKPDDLLSPEAEFLSWLSTIDLHHGEYSSTPWKELHVYGAAVSPARCSKRW